MAFVKFIKKLQVHLLSSCILCNYVCNLKYGKLAGILSTQHTFPCLKFSGSSSSEHGISRDLMKSISVEVNVLYPIRSHSLEKCSSPADLTFCVRWKFSNRLHMFSAALDLPCIFRGLKMKRSWTGSKNELLKRAPFSSLVYLAVLNHLQISCLSHHMACVCRDVAYLSTTHVWIGFYLLPPYLKSKMIFKTKQRDDSYLISSIRLSCNFSYL